ncbi:SRPBCC family protein [Streptomyces brasiliensis]|uniref:DUF2867 domain-containing protein n=1 Tax=Streptomyces brasiliensis TaxID=1954 RepID=A0A917K4U1_9ACTN|nr:SRPBCC family protein [Streptomyces brasiliensis]GGJ00062.1 hypothetical protein GCM10010121_007980 [Streptomyces brasiliensis]
MDLAGIAALPYVDEHATLVAAEPDAVWNRTAEVLDRAWTRPRAARYARLVGCADKAASGPRPLAVGSTVPGFRVVAADPGRRLVFAGGHRFSTYALTFRLEPEGPGRTRLRAETRAAFPGLSGRLYRWLVIGTGGHAAGMRRLLATIARGSR